MQIYARHLLTENGFESDKTVTIKDGMITSIQSGQVGEYVAEYLTPGLIDLHCHGSAGFDPLQHGLSEMADFLESMCANGVTDFLMTISSDEKTVMRHGLEVTRQAMQLQREGKLGGACICGVHLEGPFLSRDCLGAMQKSAILNPDIQTYKEYFGDYEDIIKKVTLAPEESGADKLISYLKQKKVCVQAGHTNATYDQAMQGFSKGIDSLAHSFNACRGIHHREPGIIVAAMEKKNVYMEVICDLLHLHPAIVKLIYHMKTVDKMILISDATATNGLPDGEYRVDGFDIIVKDGVSRTKDGVLNGGGAYLSKSVCNLVSIGIPFEAAVTMATKTPSKQMGFCELGKIELGKRAHLLAWSNEYQPVFTVVGNEVKKGTRSKSVIR